MIPKKYEVVPIGITKEGRWVTSGHAEKLLRGEAVHEDHGRHLRAGDPQATASAAVLAKGDAVIVPPMPQSDSLVPFESAARAADHGINVDVIFPVLHGTFGEDGTIQGLLELADIPYVGAGVLGSAAGMDKDIMKRLFAAAGLAIVKHVTILRAQWEKEPKKVIKEVESKLQLSGVCEACKPGLVSRDIEGARTQRTRPRHRRGSQLRSQDCDRAGRGRQEAQGP